MNHSQSNQLIILSTSHLCDDSTNPLINQPIDQTTAQLIHSQAADQVAHHRLRLIHHRWPSNPPQTKIKAFAREDIRDTTLG